MAKTSKRLSGEVPRLKKILDYAASLPRVPQDGEVITYEEFLTHIASLEQEMLKTPSEGCIK